MKIISIGKSVLFATALSFSIHAVAGDKIRLLQGELDLRQAQQTFSTESDEGIWLIQFQHHITAQTHRDLKALGAQVYRYFPDDALVMRASRQKVLAHFGSEIQGSMPFRGSFKLSETLPTVSVFSTARPQVVSISVISANEVKSALSEIQRLDSSAKVIQAHERFLDVRINESLIPRLSQIAEIESVEQPATISLMHVELMDQNEVATAGQGDYSDFNGFESGTKVMNFEAAWREGFSGAGQIVGIADTGLDRGESGLVSEDFQNSVTKGYSFGVGAKNWSDPMGHGTHVAGSVAGRSVTAKGTLRGGAYSATLIPQGMWSPLMDNLTVPPKLGDLFAPAFADGARIHTNSWGSPRNPGAYDSMAQQADDFLWNHDRMLILFAAGNSGVDKDKNGVIDPNSVGSPGTAKNVLTVGASENLLAVGGIQKQIKELRAAADNWSVEPIWSSKLSDNPNGVACFSSRGPTLDGRLKPEVVAPGTNILSARSHEPGAQSLWGVYNDHYVYSGGTSMATPLVAGAAAVVREVLTKKHGVADPSGALVKATLMHTAFDMYPGQYGAGSPTQELQVRPNSDEGYGRVDMAKVMSLTAATTKFIDSTGVGTGETQTYTVQVKANQQMMINLVYFDAPASPTVSKTLVNDLDLALVGPGKGELAVKDSINNHEIIETDKLKPGTYQIQVRGANVPMGKAGKQPYALVYSVY